MTSDTEEREGVARSPQTAQPCARRTDSSLPELQPFGWHQAERGFGGRPERYKVHKRSLCRIFDPVERCFQTFSHPRLRGNWLLRRFDPHVFDIDTLPPAVAYQRSGRRFAAQPHLAWSRRDGTRVLEWVADHWRPEVQLRLEHFALTHGVEVSLRPWSSIRMHQAMLLENLEAARQNMTIRMEVDLVPLMRHVTACLRLVGAATRGDLRVHLQREGAFDSVEQLDAALFHMHIRGELALELTGDLYADHTTIRE